MVGPEMRNINVYEYLSMVNEGVWGGPYGRYMIYLKG